ncbi:SidA/IucD/PvdA family monooxygenase [Desulfofundulus thermobenzoicus]|uniref:SidA/IucD/PvdA family monooxygenase n=1 Tax=Desulfofundulus thermobenzoicus TaxID=29376 RepID=A0A6N7IR56_9FIRM|nr:FAD-dependent oxidoreductase [Desulfofundulus thermobenzoicus]MQL52520.1 SidA/IucD/PvdA family monooxygenase [Desulfofundulus thermobenzoicus]
MHYVILGASAAGISAARAVRRHDPDGEITMVAADRQVYSRCLLPRIISSERTEAEISFVEKDFFDRLKIDFLPGCRVVRVKPDTREVVLQDGRVLGYDRLLVATGASPTLPPVENLNRARPVFTLRHLEDALAIKEAVGAGTRVAVLGGGLVGLEAAEALLTRGAKVTVIELAPRLLPLQLDATAAAVYEKLFRERGAEIITGQGAYRVELEGDLVRALVLNDGTIVPCHVILVAAGVRPNVDFLEGTGVAMNRGIVVDRHMRTSLPDIYAAGDVCESMEAFTGRVSPTPIWPAAVIQGRVAGMNMAGVEAEAPDIFACQNAMTFFQVPTIACGRPDPPEEGCRVETACWPGGYRKVIRSGNRLHGAILQGDIAGAGVFNALTGQKVDISGLPGSLLTITYAPFFRMKADGSFSYK